MHICCAAHGGLVGPVGCTSTTLTLTIGRVFPPLRRRRRAAYRRRRPASNMDGARTTMDGSGMTQEMEALAVEGDEGVELTDEEADAGARAYDAAQVPAN